MKVLYRLDNNLIKYAGDYTFENTDGVVTVFWTNPTTQVKNTIVRFQDDTFDFYGQADVTSIPSDFTPFKYKWINNTFVLNPTYVDPLAITSDAVANIAIAMPKDLLPNYAEIKANALIAQWLVINERMGDTSPLSQPIRDGLKLLDSDDSTLTADQISWKKAAINLKYKLIARYRIEGEVGDPYDLGADNNKQINLITGILVRLYRLLKLNVPIPPDIEANYDNFANLYAAAVDSGQYKDRTDLEDPAILVNTLMSRNALIAQIVEEEYFSKKV